MPAKRPAFADLWDFRDQKRSDDIRLYSTFEKAALGTSAVLLLRSGMGGPWGVAAGLAYGGAVNLANAKLEAMQNDFMADLIRNGSHGDPALQDIAERIFKKAGLKQQPVIRILNSRPESRDLSLKNILEEKWFKPLDSTVAIGQGEPVYTKDKAVIVIGSKIASLLTREEMAAVIAHETSHALITPPGRAEAEKTYTKASNVFSAVASRGTLALKGVSSSLPFMALNLVRSQSINKAKRTDEERADRNSIALFPHPTALKTALQKVTDQQYAGLPKDSSLLNALKDVSESMAVHKKLSARLDDADRFYAEVSAFYAEHNLPLDTAFILSGEEPGQQPPKKSGGRRPKP